ncbi:hypothetical protein [Prevotella jejuni]
MRIPSLRSPHLPTRRYALRSKEIRIWRQKDAERRKEETMKGWK